MESRLGWKFYTSCTVTDQNYLTFRPLTESYSPDSKWKHEHGSEMMFDALVRENDVQVNELERKFIKALISGDVSRM